MAMLAILNPPNDGHVDRKRGQTILMTGNGPLSIAQGN